MGLMQFIEIDGRKIGPGYPPLVIAEIGINHEGEIKKAIQMVDDAKAAGCECVKFQCHIISDEMIPNKVIPGNTSESIWDIMSRCALNEKDELFLKEYVESKDLIYLSTPFSRDASIRLEKMGVSAFKIGSGECNNYPLIEHIAQYGKPVILSTGMNDIKSIEPSVKIFREEKIPFALLHCTSIYPTPYSKVRLGAINDLRQAYPDAILGLSDHSIGNYTCFASVALGASIVEKHFTSDKNWPGPDNPISIEPNDLKDLIIGTNAIFQAVGGSKNILLEEKPTIDFAYACVVSTHDIIKGDVLTTDNTWVKRPGTGEIKAKDYETILGKRVVRDIKKDQQIRRTDIQ
jgi:sialic acid synthase SpsE